MRNQTVFEARVVAFDREAGVGTVAVADGVEHDFHATAIADGTRDISVGTRVLVGLAAVHGGRIEATLVAPIGT